MLPIVEMKRDTIGRCRWKMKATDCGPWVVIKGWWARVCLRKRLVKLSTESEIDNVQAS